MLNNYIGMIRDHISHAMKWLKEITGFKQPTNVYFTRGMQVTRYLISTPTDKRPDALKKAYFSSFPSNLNLFANGQICQVCCQFRTCSLEDPAVVKLEHFIARYYTRIVLKGRYWYWWNILFICQSISCILWNLHQRHRGKSVLLKIKSYNSFEMPLGKSISTYMYSAV